jgi:hypothetical protein
MRRLAVILTLVLMMPAAALPPLAQEGDPLAESVLLPNVVGWALFGLAVVLMLLFILWTRRNPS